MVKALLGADALYRRESGDGDGLAVLNMDREGRYAAEAFGDYADAEARFTALRADADVLPELDRRVYYRELCDSTLAFLEWRSRGLPFREQLSRFLHVPAEPAADEDLDRLRADMGEVLVELGYPGDLPVACAQWEADSRVPPQRVPERLNELLSEAWDRSVATLLPLPAPKADGMRARGVSGVAYNARCDYAHRTIYLNTDPVLTDPALKHLAVHEGYGGHYVQFKLREHFVGERMAPPDNLLSLVNSASSCVFEGIADAAMEMMGWVDSPHDRLQGLMNRYRAGIGTVAAWRLHDQGHREDLVAGWLRKHALTGGEGWVANRMKFIAAPARAVLIWSYWWGEPVVGRAWRSAPSERRTEFLRYLYGRMHSNSTVGMFA
jgi:hypothetical protein